MHSARKLSFRLGLTLSIKTFLCAVALTLIPARETPAQSQPVNPPCVELNGTFYFTVLTFDENGAAAHGEGIVKDGDEVIATFIADYLLKPRGNGVIHSTANHTISFLDGSGSIVTADEIRLLDGRANSRLYIVGGTGQFEGASGLLHTHGTIMEGIGFKGQLCIR